MADAIANRGPDGAGVWADTETRASRLAHRRLAIVDLTPTGAQPMVSADGRWVISYNGEVYNAESHRAPIRIWPDLPGAALPTPRSSSNRSRDGASIARSPISTACSPSRCGIAPRARLHLVRDRLGIKPLFYAQTAAASALPPSSRAFTAAGFKFDIDPASVASFLRFGYVPAPHSIYRERRQASAGRNRLISAGRADSARRIYWSLEERRASRGINRPFAGSDAEAEERLHALLANAVSINMISDVPLGAFLSGGIDSSTVAALMVAAKRGPVRTFSIGFPDFGYDESVHAKAVARHLGTAHEELIRHRGRRARHGAAACRYVRRAVCRFIADPDPRHFQDDASARHRRSCRATAATNCLPVTTAIRLAAGHLARLAQLPLPIAPCRCRCFRRRFRVAPPSSPRAWRRPRYGLQIRPTS